jgi:hypothetical protein
MKTAVDHAREMMNMLRNFQQPGTAEEGATFEGMRSSEVRDLAEGAAVLIEACAKSLPSIVVGDVHNHVNTSSGGETA